MAVGSPQTKENFDAGTDDPKQSFTELAANVDLYNTLVNTLLKALSEADAGDGLLVTAGVAAVDLAADPGLEFSTAKLRAKIAATNPGLVRNANGLAALVAAARGVKITSSGLEIDIPGLTEDTSPDLAADFIPIYDASGAVIKKVKPENIGSPAGLTLIQNQSVSSSVASVDFTSGIDSTYDLYMLVITGASSTTSSVVTLRISISSAFKSGSLNYNYYTTVVGGSSQAQEDFNAIRFGKGANHPTGEKWDYVLWFTRPADGLSYFTWEGQTDKGNPDYITGQGNVQISGVIDGLRILMESGNLDDGEYSLYGIKRS